MAPWGVLRRWSERLPDLRPFCFSNLGRPTRLPSSAPPRGGGPAGRSSAWAFHGSPSLTAPAQVVRSTAKPSTEAGTLVAPAPASEEESRSSLCGPCNAAPSCRAPSKAAGCTLKPLSSPLPGISGLWLTEARTSVPFHCELGPHTPWKQGPYCRPTAASIA